MFDEGTILEGGKAPYEIVEELSMGEFAVSYKAKNTKSGEAVFLKKYIDPTPLLKEEYATFVSHQKAVNALLNTLSGSFEKVLDDFEFSHHYYVVKPFYDATSLEKWLTQEHTEPELLAVAGGLSTILVEMEQAGIVHFDLKPPQVMVDKATGAPLLCDFDFSVIAGKSKAHKVAMTPFYFATEHLKRDLAAFTQATNVFLMALVIFEMVTRGHKPHLAEDVEQYEQAIAGYKVRRLKELLPGAAPPIDELLYRALDPDPAKRPAPAEFVAAFASGKLAGPAVAKRLELRTPSSLPLSIWQDTVVGRDEMRIFGDERKFTEKKQFRLWPGPEGWLIEELPGTTNRTKLNGTPLPEGPVALENGSELQIGPLKLQVKFVY